jgi:hypothetical protein
MTDLDGRRSDGRGGRDDQRRLIGRRRERLLDEDRDAAFDGGERDGQVGGGRGGDDTASGRPGDDARGPRTGR